MRKGVLCLVFVLFFITGCREFNSTKSKDDNSGTEQSNQEKKVPGKDSMIKKDSAEVNDIHFLLPGSDTLIAERYINGFKEQPVITFSVTRGKMIHAIVMGQNDTANLRINQIEMPDSTFDGPFGKDMQYKIKTPGTYKLIIGESMMDEGEWSGNFTIKIWVE